MRSKDPNDTHHDMKRHCSVFADDFPLSRSASHYDIDGELAEGKVERYAKRRHAKASACILVMTLAD